VTGVWGGLRTERLLIGRIGKFWLLGRRGRSREQPRSNSLESAHKRFYRQKDHEVFTSTLPLLARMNHVA
jgi:hypothetical protein